MLNKKNIYIGLIVISLILVLVAEYNKPKKINWTPSYVYKHKLPLGCYVINDIFKNKFDEIQQINESPVQYLSRKESQRGTYIFINDQVSFDTLELEYLLDWTSKGNQLFIAASTIDIELLDSLKLEVQTVYSGYQGAIKPLFYHQLTHPKFSKELYKYDKETSFDYFSSLDTLNSRVISVVDKSTSSAISMEDRYANGIVMPFGSGQIVLSLAPQTFTNYFILKDSNREYTSGLVSYIPQSTPLLLDNFNKRGKSTYSSPMYIFLNNKPLKWAYYVFILGTIIYVLFEGKRKQRVIPIQTRLKNQTLEYTKLIANMYFENKNTKQVVQHKIVSFLEYIRSHFYLNTSDLDSYFMESLAAKSNHSLQEVKELFEIIEKLKNKGKIQNNELLAFNEQIEKFKEKAHGK